MVPGERAAKRTTSNRGRRQCLIGRRATGDVHLRLPGGIPLRKGPYLPRAKRRVAVRDGLPESRSAKQKAEEEPAQACHSLPTHAPTRDSHSLAYADAILPDMFAAGSLGRIRWLCRCIQLVLKIRDLGLIGLNLSRHHRKNPCALDGCGIGLRDYI